jgi:MSHA biogenesis protein MshJ
MMNVASAKDWLIKIDALSVKERGLVLLAAILTLLMAWDSLLMQPLERERARLQSAVGNLDQALQETQIAAGAVIAAGKLDPDLSVQERLAREHAELAKYESDIKANIGRMVPPEKMAAVLESVLTRFDDLEFIGLEGLKVEPLVAASEETSSAPTVAESKTPANEQQAYRHGIRIRFSGSYPQAVAYLRALEALPWGFFWESVELETDEYPRAQGSIVVYTLSLDRAWIGV